MDYFNGVEGILCQEVNIEKENIHLYSLPVLALQR